MFFDDSHLMDNNIESHHHLVWRFHHSGDMIKGYYYGYDVAL